jgi:DMSO/TMAO reductase YedYZ heme-binding membrane subunit
MAATVSSIEDALQQSHLIVLALHPTAQEQLKVFQSELQGKILIDVANVRKENTLESNAEKLQRLFPESHVVKAFNTLSAYTLMTGHSAANQDVHIAADDDQAVQAVVEVVRRLGFHANVRGKLQMARELEAMNTRLWNGWGLPVLVSFFTFAVWLMYGIVRYHYIKDHEWSRVPMNTMNKALGCAAITLLAMCYLPGCFAAFAQLVNGTKHKRFSCILDKWLKMRKQLGLIALWLACVHSMFSVAHLNPGYFAKWFPHNKITVPGNQTTDLNITLGLRMSWIGECVVAFGCFSLGLMCVLGITSLPSVGSKMIWRQWTFVQSYLGYICLFLAAVHVSFNACPSWGSTPFYLTVQKLSFLSLVLPYFTLFLRLVLLLPCFSIFIWKIRQGWERGANNNIEAGSTRMHTMVLYGSEAAVTHSNPAYVSDAAAVQRI